MSDPGSMVSFDSAALKLLFNAAVRHNPVIPVLVMDKVRTCCALARFYNQCGRGLDDINLFSAARKAMMYRYAEPNKGTTMADKPARKRRRKQNI